MKSNLIKLALIASIILIGYLILQPQPQKKHTQQEMANISTAFAQKFERARQQQQASLTDKEKATKPADHPKPAEQSTQANQQMIIAVIYKKSNATWFIKAKDSRERIQTISASFKNYFVDQLKFDDSEQPIFSHIPDSMKAANTSRMRVATYMLGGVEVSVSQLAGQQDVFANVKRWMKQVDLDDSSPILLDFSDDKNTIFVKMPK